MESSQKMKIHVSWPLIHGIYLPKYKLSIFLSVQLLCKLPPVNWQVDVVDLQCNIKKNQEKTEHLLVASKKVGLEINTGICWYTAILFAKIQFCEES
jgi:hypothetical protein